MIKENQHYIKYYEELSTVTDISTLIEYTNIVVERFQYASNWPDESIKILNRCYLAAVLKRLGEILEMSLLEKNHNILYELCNKLTVNKMVNALINSQIDIDTIRDSTSELKRKITRYLQESVKNANIEEKETTISEKMIFLAVTKKLSKDTYMFASNNEMSFGNFGAFIEIYEKGLQQYAEICKTNNTIPTNKGKSGFMMYLLLEFGAGRFKLKNNENYIIIRKVLDYLINNGHSEEQARDNVSRTIESIYYESNPYDEEIRRTTTNGREIIFKKRKRYPRQYFYDVISNFINLVNQLPIELQEIISLVLFDDERSPFDIYWEKEYNIADFFSIATCYFKEQKIAYYSKQWQTKIKIEMPTLVHEAGHAYDYNYAKDWGVETELISDSELWKDAMQKDYELTKTNGVSWYSITSKARKEDFADSISLYITNPNKLSEYPNRKRILDEKFKIERLYSSKEEKHRK